MISLVKDLPEILQSVLRGVGYHRADIALHVRESESVFCGGGAGQCAFAVLVNLATGETKHFSGSWGGSNMFSPDNQVDNDTTCYPMLPDLAVVLGSTGNRTYAQITIGPGNVIKALPAPSDLADEEKRVLAVFRAYKPAFRKSALGKRLDMVESLLSRGYLTRNKAGATQLTTAGRAACEGVSP